MRVVVLFRRLEPHHYARLDAAGRLGQVTAIELAMTDRTYERDPANDPGSFSKISLFKQDEPFVPHLMRSRLNAALASAQPTIVAIPGWSTPLALLTLDWCVGNSIPVVLMSDSALEDMPRTRWKEHIKGLIVSACSAGLVAGKRHLEYLERLGMPNARVFCGYDVVDNTHFAIGAELARQRASIIRKRFGLPQHFFLASSRFVEKKNLFRLIEAYGQYWRINRAQAWNLVLLGDGPLKKDVMRYIKKWQLNDQVLLPGFRQYAELPSFYGLAGAFVHASTTEQWGLVVNEAMAAGLPVLVSERCGCTPELVREGQNGYIFDPFNVGRLAKLLVEISGDDVQRAIMSKESIRIISHWTPDMFGANLWLAVNKARDHFAVKPRWWLRLLLRGLSKRPNAGVERNENPTAKAIPVAGYFADSNTQE
jgi:glycosyltransferase involved in cell wall biosynthesis